MMEDPKKTRPHGVIACPFHTMCQIAPLLEPFTRCLSEQSESFVLSYCHDRHV